MLLGEIATYTDHRFTFLPDSKILRAHFPGQPIVPGVCIMQMVVEAVGQDMGCRLKLVSARNVKFLAVLSPVAVSSVCLVYGVTYEAPSHSAHGIMRIKAEIKGEARVYAKMILLCEKMERRE